MSKLFSIQEVANLLGVSTKTLRRWEEKGILVPHRSPGNQRRYSQEQIDNFRRIHRGEIIPENVEQPEQIPFVSETQISSTDQDQSPQEFTDVKDDAASDWTDKNLKSIAAFKRMAVAGVIVMAFVGLSAVAFATLKSNNLLDKDKLARVMGISTILNPASDNSSIEIPRYDGRAVLGTSTQAKDLLFGVNIPSEFAKTTNFLDSIRVAGIATLSGGIVTEDANIDAGEGELTASNVIYSITAGSGITVTPGQNPVISSSSTILSLAAGTGISIGGTTEEPQISNTGVTSVNGSTGSVTLAAGSGISISGLTISNSLNTFGTIDVTGSNTITAGSGTDTLTFTAGSGVTLSSNSSTKTLTISSPGGVNYWDQTSGTLQPFNTTVDLLLGGTSTASADFAFFNVNSGTPTASISAGSTGDNTYLTGAGTLATTNMQTLTLGGGTTGNITLDPISGGGKVNVTGSISLANGKDYQINNTSVLSSTVLGSSVVTSSLTSVGALSSGSIATGFGNITTANTITGGTVNSTGNIQTGGTNRISSGGNLTNIGTTQFNTVTYTWPGSDAAASGYVLSSNGAGTLSWISAGSSVNYWNQTSGTLQPFNSTVDLLIGGVSTSAAKFAFVNVNSGTPTASISAGTTGNNTYLTGDGILATTNKQTLTLGSSSTGNIVLAPNGTAALSTSGTNLVGAGTLTGLTGLTSSGTITFSGFTSNGGPLYTNGSGVLAQITAGTSSQCLLGGTTPSFGSCGSGVTTDVFWNQSSLGVLYPNNLTVDLAIGGQTTAAARFAVTGVNSGIPTATLSAGTAGGAYLTADGTLATTANQSLTIGGGTTGNITLSPFAGSGTVLSTGTLNLSSGKDYQIAGSSVLSATTLGSSVVTSSLTSVGALSSGSIATGFGNITTANTITGGTVNSTGNIQTGGTNRISSGGNLTNIGTTQFNTVTYTWPGSDGSAGYALTTNGLGTLSWTNSNGFGWWNQTSNGVLHPHNATVDLVLGSNATSTARFAVKNILTGVPTATLSAGTAGGSYLTADGTLSTTAMQTLTLGGTTTGNIVIDSGTGVISLSDSVSITGSGADLSFTGGGTNTISSTGTLEIGAHTLTGAITGNSQNVTGLSNLSAGGTITFSGFTSNGGPLYTNGSGVLAQVTAGTSSQCLLGGTTPSFGSCSAGETTDLFWNQSAGLIFPNNSTVDFAIGGQSTVAAKFAITGVNDGTPIATLSASTNGNGLVLTGSTSTIQSLKNNTLTIGGTSTGNIVLSPINGSGDVKINGTTTLNNLTYTWPSSQSSGYVLSTNGSGTLSWTDSSTLGTNYWTLDAAGVLYPKNLTVDLLLGNTATSTAKIALINVLTGTPTASISANSGANATFLTGLGNLGTTNMQTLTLGGASTGDVRIQPNADTGDYFKFQSDNTNLTLSTTDGSNLTITPEGTLNLNSTGDMTLDSSTDINLDADGADVVFKDGGSAYATFTNSSADLTITTGGGNILSASALNIGGAAAAAYNYFATDISGSSTPDGLGDLYVQDELEVDGTTRFNNLTYTWPSSQSSGYVLSTNGSGTLSWTDPSTFGTNWWNQTAGTLQPFNATVDLLLGSTATSTAEFAVIGINDGTPTASISATTNGNGLTLVGSSATIQSLKNNALTIGGTSTGDITLSPLNGSGTVNNTGHMNLSSGKEYRINGTSVLSSSTLGSGVTVSSLTQVGTITTGTWTASIIGSTYGGTGANLGSSAQGTVPYFSSTGVMSALAVGTSGQCLTTSGAAANPTWRDCALGSTTNWWNQSSGILYPINETLDFALGSTSTGSAEFSVLGVNDGTPTASISATTNGNGLTLVGSSATIQSLRNNPLTIGGTSTGDITLSPLNGSGTVTSTGNLTLSSGKIFSVGASAGQTLGTASCVTTTGGIVTGSSSCPGGTNWWTETSPGGALTLINSTMDLLVGGTSSTAAKFAFINVNTNTPTASISAGSVGNNTYLTGAGNLATTNSQTLTLGGSTTGSITLDPIGGSGTVTSTGNLNLSSGKAYQINGTSVLSATTLGSGVTASSLTQVGTIATGTWQASVIGSTYGGTGANLGSSAQGTVPYFSSTGVMSALAVGTSGQCLTTNGAAANPTWQTCALGSSTNWWTQANGAIYPLNTTLDLLVGGTSTSAAKFSVNVGSSTPGFLTTGHGAIGATQTAINSGRVLSIYEDKALTSTLRTFSLFDVRGTITSPDDSNDYYAYGANINPTFGLGDQNNLKSIASGLRVNVDIDSATNCSPSKGCFGYLSAIDASLKIPAGVLMINSNAIDVIRASVSATLDNGSNAFNLFHAVDSSVAAGSSVYGLYIDPLTSGSTRYGIYQAGTTATNSNRNVLAGNTTIGSTSTPNAALDVVGNATVSGNLTFYGAARTISATAMNSLTFGDSATGGLFFKPANVQTLLLNPVGRIGMGTQTAPIGLVDIAGNPGQNAALIVNNTGTSATDDLFTASSSGTTKFTINSWGSVFATSSAVGTNAFSFTDNLLTTGNGINATFNALTTGKGLNLTSTSLATSSAILANIDHTASYTQDGTTVTGNELNLNRALTTNSIQFDATSNGGVGGSSTTTLSWSHTTGLGTNRMLILSVTTTYFNSNETVATGGSAPTYGSQTFSPISGCTASNAGNTRQELWYLAAPASGTGTITVTLANNSSSKSWQAGAVSYSGVSQVGAGAFGTCATATGNSAALSTGTVTGTAGDLIIDGSGFTAASTAVTVGSGQTQRFSTLVSGLVRTMFSDRTGPTGTNTWSINGGTSRQWAAVGVAMKPATSINLSGALAKFTSNCTETLGTCTDSSNILSLTQSFGLSTGAVLNITGSGLGSGINVSANAGGQAAVIINDTGSGDIFTASASGTPRFKITNAGDVRTVGSLCVKATMSTACAGSTAGTIYATNTTVQSADVAENYVSSQELEPGDLVIAANDGNDAAVLKATQSANRNPIGIISTDPGVTLNSDAITDETHPYMYPIALAGRVPVKVSTENGSIQVGDPLAMSSIPGVAAKAIRPGVIVGTALQPYDNSDTTAVDKILAYANITWHDPGVYIAANGTLANPYAQFTNEQASQLLGLIGQNPTPPASGSAQTTPESTPSGSFDILSDPDFLSLRDRVGSAEGNISSLQGQISSLSDQIASQSAFIASVLGASSSGSASESGEFVSGEDLDIGNATVSGDLHVLGRTTLTDLGVTGNIAAGLLSIHGLDPEVNGGSGGATINSIGDLSLQNNGLGGINILSGKVKIDTDGNITSEGEITAKKVKIDTQDSSSKSLGSATIEAGETSIEIETTAVTSKSRILVTATSKTGNQVLVVTQKTAGSGFKVEIEDPISQDIKFDWLIVDEK